MQTYIQYLNTLSVKTLHEIAREMVTRDPILKGYSKLRKVDLISALRVSINIDAMEAYSIDKAKPTNCVQEDQIRAWWHRSGLNTLETISAQAVLDAIESDHQEAIEIEQKARHARNQCIADAYSAQVVARNNRRLAGYKSQVGKNRFGGAAFTKRQAKRMTRKAHKAQKAYLALLNA